MADKAVKRAARKLVVLEEGQLVALALNKDVAAEFPFLAPLASIAKAAPARRGCGACGTANNDRAAAFQKAKAAVAGMDSARKRRLKQILNAEQVRVLYRRPSGKGEELTF